MNVAGKVGNLLR